MADDTTDEVEGTEVPAPADALPADAWQDEDWEKFLGEYYSGGAAGDSEAEQAPEDQPAAAEATSETEDTPQGAVTPSSSTEQSAGSTSEASGAEDGPAAGTSAPDYIDIGGQRIPAEHAERVAAFWQWMNEYPEQAIQFMGYLNGEYTLTPAEAAAAQAAAEAQAPPEPKPRPEDEDWTFVPDSVKEAISELDEVKGRLETYDQWVATLQAEQERNAAAQAMQAINVGIDKFRENYDVSDADLEQLRREAGQLGIADRLAQQYGDPVRAVAESLELAYLRNPAFRDRETARQVTQAQQDQQRQRKLGALGGSGAPPTRKSGPSTPEDRRAAMVREIREAVNNG